MNQDENNSLGIVEVKTVKLELPDGGFKLESGQNLSEIDVAYETYSTLAAERDNVVFVCHALTGDAHVAGRHKPDDPKPGWWDEMIGPGKGIDTQNYCVICANVLGGCKGTTGPSSTNPATGKPYGSAFPSITVGDMVDVQKLLLEQIGIERLAAVIGGSLGGMQVLEWSVRYPDKVDNCICIGAASSITAQALAFNAVGRDAIKSDACWNGGDYYETGNAPLTGLAQARKLAHITYLSPEIMTKKFGRGQKDGRFEIDSYLEHKGQTFVDRFDANSYLRIAEAMDKYDLAESRGTVKEAFEKAQSKFLIVALSSDWLFPPEQSRELANALLAAGRQVSYCYLKAPYGHDAFLINIEHLAATVKAFLPWVSQGEIEESDRKPVIDRKPDYDTIVGMVKKNARVLDLGCGSGGLLTVLAEERAIAGAGIDINLEDVIRVLDKGFDIFHRDIDAGLAMVPDGAYDYAVLGQTLQFSHKPQLVLREMLRVAKEGIVSFPNSAKLTDRLRFALGGRMPRSGETHLEWYDTRNIHVTTMKDFVDLCRHEGVSIVEEQYIANGSLSNALAGCGLGGLCADLMVVKIARAG